MATHSWGPEAGAALEGWVEKVPRLCVTVVPRTLGGRNSGHSLWGWEPGLYPLLKRPLVLGPSGHSGSTVAGNHFCAGLGRVQHSHVMERAQAPDSVCYGPGPRTGMSLNPPSSLQGLLLLIPLHRCQAGENVTHTVSGRPQAWPHAR
jgi:hypothetical protein